jgi:hypothetical protein
VLLGGSQEVVQGQGAHELLSRGDG